MTIDKQRWFYRAWASTYMDAHRPPPERVTLCAMFWRTVAVWCLRLFIIAALLVLIGLFGIICWRRPDVFAELAVFLGSVVGAAGAVVAVTHVVDLLDAPDAVRNSVPVAIVRAWKEKVCPLVTFTDAEHEDDAA